MSRLENTVTKTDLLRLGKCLIENFINSNSKAPSVIILDCDDTNNDTYGQQEQALFKNYYNEYCYMPLHIYEGSSGKLITTILKPGRKNKQVDIAKLLKKLISIFYTIAKYKDYSTWRQPFGIAGFYGLDVEPT